MIGTGLLHSGFARSVADRGDRPALRLGEITWSYGELDEIARSWAGAILKMAPQPRRIGLFAHRSLASYAGLIAILYTGATAVPLNPKFPGIRTRTMIEMADLDAIIVDDPHTGRIRDVLARHWRIPVAETADAVAATPLKEPHQPETSDFAYLLFTSGSTGRPKGVAITHRNADHFLQASAERYCFTPADRFSQTFDQTFDLAMFDVFMAWSSGGCLVPLNDADLLSPFRLVREQAITVWFSVPAVAALLRHRRRLTAGSLESLRWSLFCGESLPLTSAREWQRAAPKSIVENLYGPTETTIACTAHRWDPEKSAALAVNGSVPIGAPYPGMSAEILAGDGSWAATGMTGELCIAGPQVFSGYWRDQAQTQASLFTVADRCGTSRTWYRTGDLARRLSNGEYAYIGRLDSQVKIRGNRIELGEVQAALENESGVVQAVALAVPGRVADTSELIAVVTGTGLDAASLLDALRRKLPPVMVPSQLHILGELPLTANGKVDRVLLCSRFS